MEYAIRSVAQRLSACADEVEQALIQYSAGEDDDFSVLLEAQRYSLLDGGKRIRPFLVNEVCRALGGSREASMPFACAMEMVHTYSLIHDDLPCMDDDDLRRGKPSNHKQFGEATALLAGDALLTKAFLTAASNPHASAEACACAVRLLAEAAGDRGMIGGQVMDLNGEAECLPMEKLLRLHSLKTGALMRCSALLGALAAGKMPDTEEARAAEAYADAVGLAFQVIDDILDRTATAEQLGKSVGGDAAHHKTTFLTYYTCDAAKQYAAELTARAVSAISDWDESQTLTDLAVYLLERTH